MAKALWPVSFVVLANAPARYAMAARERQFGSDMATTFAMAVLADVACLAPLFALFLLPADWLATRRSTRRWTADLGHGVAMGTVVLVSAFMWVVSIGATEFRIQRGTYPTLIETMEGLGDVTFLRGSVQIVLFERYSWPTLVAAFAWTGVLVAYGRTRLRADAMPGPADERAHQHSVAGRALLVAPRPTATRRAIREAVGSLVWTGCAVVLFLCIRAVAKAPTPSGLAPPIVRLGADALFPRRASRHAGVRGVLEAIEFDETPVRSGLHWLGFGDTHARCLLDGDASCAPHPLARPLPGDGTQAHLGGARGEEPTPLVRSLLRLSSALFDERNARVTVWHVALESFRADDVQALNPAAPAQIAPFVNAAYAATARDGPRTVAFRHAYQSGLRTAHAVSGLWCGLGALPFQLALSRDLIDLPLRCVPDVLRDAGFETRLYYGSNASFEHLGEFAGRHGVAVTDLATLPPGLPRGAFRAVTDAALLRVAREDSAEAGQLAYRFVLTLSGHSPFDLPEDMAPAIEGDVMAALGRANFAGEDRRRLLTMAYTDGALAAFVHEIERSRQANQTILLVSADHATADRFLWGESTAQGMARVPLFFYLPAAFIADSKDPARVEEELRSLEGLASTLAVSINDAPTLLLALLARQRALLDLAPAMRWHTLGGATSSPNFEGRAPTTAQVWGIDAWSHVFLVHRDAVDQPLATGECSVAFSVWDQRLGPVLKDVSSAVSAVLRACSGRCPGLGDMPCCTSFRQSVHVERGTSLSP